MIHIEVSRLRLIGLDLFSEQVDELNTIIFPLENNDGMCSPCIFFFTKQFSSP